MSINSYLLLILSLFLLLALAACDNDSSGNAQDMTDSTCPCFSAHDIKDDAIGRNFDGCSFVPNDLNLAITLFDGDNPFLILVQCMDAEFGTKDCACTDLVRDIEISNLTKEQFFNCSNILADAIVNEFGENSQSMCLLSN